MCGLTGFFDPSGNCSEKDMTTIVKKMATTLRHRGPDDDGIWCDGDAGIAIGHRRLAIIDLSPQGHQPMVSGNGEWVVAYNGEVYNFPELHADLVKAGIPFKGRSDTEVILEGCAHWGVAETINRLVGMFAIALWNRKTRSLTLVRDRLGIKPLYWGNPTGKSAEKSGGLFLFGSELKSLTAHPSWRGGLNRDALAAFLRYGYVPTPGSIYADIHKLAPGHMLTLSSGAAPEIRTYWSLAETIEAGRRAPLDISRAEAVSQIEALIMQSVKDRMVADVPLGALLSGGIDSSTISACMQAQSAEKVRTFTIGFTEGGYDESTQAAAIARHLGTDHSELRVAPGHARDLIPRLAEIYDEPFADSSQIPTCLVSALAREKVTVALSGDGGDEVFLGYNRYKWADRVWRYSAGLPSPLRSAAAAFLQAPSPAAWDGIGRVLPASLRPRLMGEKLHKLASVFQARTANDIYTRLLTPWADGEEPVAGVSGRNPIFEDKALNDALPDFPLRMSAFDTLTYLPDDILTKIDRASMAVSLETRVPLIDHRLVEFVWRLPPALRRGSDKGMGISKSLLREVLYRHVPRQLVDRPKMGFGVPIDSWLRGELRDWAEELISEPRLKAEGLINPEPVRRAWTEHLSGRRNNQHALWNVLMFQAWNANRNSATGG